MDEELYWSITNLIEFAKTSDVELCDCPNCTVIKNSIYHCQQFCNNYKAERKHLLN